MKKAIVLTLFFIAMQSSYAQMALGLQGNFIAPSGNEKYSLKPTAGFELKLSGGEIDKRFKMGVAIGYASFKPTQDTFRIYGTQTGGTASNGTLLQPGYEHIYNYRVASIGFYSDFKILDKKKFSPTFGLDFYTYLVTLNEDYAVEGQISVHGQYENELSYSFAFIPKVGLSYELKDNWLITGGEGYNLAFYSSAALRTFWKSYIGVSYYF